MPLAPITVRAPRYTGSNAKRLARLRKQVVAARKLEEYVNSRVAHDGHVVLAYEDIARELSLDKAIVRDLLGEVGGGNTGITVWVKTTSRRASSNC